ncbi:MAG: hypothetical protein CVV21_10085 [Candidatus Goldiibacteriota bacterium HGW-Goldbacteria-1]|jgi:predicted nuclease of restriction endonuclease-like (RecB) superfamily|nr:MAG: hypothetical protein CVV21_10085 [Candidatus Goldiibacteriota bacterium HGW-Goldbacteria-1]
MKRKSVNGYEDFLGEIKRRIRRAQYDALKAVNKKLIGLYWDLGKMIHEKQVKLGWGKGVVENLAKDIQKEYPGIQGFSADNMWRMRKLFLMYSDNTKLAPMVQEIGWTHNVVIMESCKDNEERAFYIQMTKKFGWTKNVLIHQIEAGTYLRYLKNQTNFNEAVPEKYRNQAKLAVKDEYTFDFLELPEEHEERELEKALIGKINKFLTRNIKNICLPRINLKIVFLRKGIKKKVLNKFKLSTIYRQMLIGVGFVNCSGKVRYNKKI